MTLTIETATLADLPGMVGVLADDQVGGHGDRWTDETAPAYRAAFAEITADPNAELIVAREDDAVLGLLLLRFNRSISDRGALRAILQSVFVGAAARGKGVGRRMVAEAERRATLRGADFVNLLSNKKRTEAHRFYRTLGYDQSHEGFKKKLPT
jgi:GNAT superfamily N-acetyltransferase